MRKVRELNGAIISLDYAKVEHMLADPEIPVNLDIMDVELPLKVMYLTKNSRMARLFLSCPRVDWLSLTWNRNLLTLEQDYGIKFITSLYGLYNRQKYIVHSKMDFFYYLDDSFEDQCPAETAEIYKRIVEELVKVAETEDLSCLLLNTIDSYMATKVALKYCKNLNIRYECGETLLHHVSDPELAQLLIDAGADVNAVDHHEETPFMGALGTNRSGIIALLVENGANVEIARLEFIDNDALRLLLDIFPRSESQIRELLLKASELDFDSLQLDFEKYPNFKEVFYSDLPRHLPAIYFNTTDQFVEIEQWSNEDWLIFLKQIFSRYWSTIYKWYHEIASARADLIKSHANELLHIAVKADQKKQYDILIHEFNADPNYLIDSKTPLFFAKLNLIKCLLKNGADPFIECDGYLFYERDDFYEQRSHNYFGVVLQLLYEKGFDLFTKKNRKSGKSVVDHFLPSENIEVGWSISIPLTKLCNQLFEVFSSDKPDFLAAIDDEGNTLSHYLCSGNYDLVKDIRFSDLKAAKNKAGKSALDVIIEKDHRFEVLGFMLRLDDFKIYIEACEFYYGNNFIEMHGYRLINSQLNELKNFYFGGFNLGFDLLKYLVVEKGIPLNVLTDGERTDALDNIILECVCMRITYRDSEKGKLEELVNFLLDSGYDKFHESICGKLVKINLLSIFDRFIDGWEDLNLAVENLASSKPHFNETFRFFIQHPRIRETRPEKCRNNCTTLDQHFFSLCHDSLEIAQFLVESGVDARRLIDSGNYSSFDTDDDDDNDDGEEENENENEDNEKTEAEVFESVIPYLIHAVGWTLEDFKGIYLRADKTLFDYFMRRSTKFGECVFAMLDTMKFEQLSLNDIIGDANTCAICRDTFENHDSLVRLECKHIFHEDCARIFVSINFQCPYCLGPIGSPVPK